MKVGRTKDPLYKDSYFGITSPTFIPPFEAPEDRQGPSPIGSIVVAFFCGLYLRSYPPKGTTMEPMGTKALKAYRSY